MNLHTLIIIPIALILPVLICRWHKHIYAGRNIPSDYAFPTKGYLFLFQCAYVLYRLGVFFAYACVMYLIHVAISGGTGVTIQDGVYSLRAFVLFYAAPIIIHSWSIEIYIGDILIYYLSKNRFRRYLDAVDWYLIRRRHQYNLTFWLLITVPITIGSFLVVRWHAEFTPSNIYIQYSLSVNELRKEYSDITTILTAPTFEARGGTRVDSREYAIVFDDSQVYDTCDNISFMSADTKRALIQLVSERSGISLTEVPVLKRELLY